MTLAGLAPSGSDYAELRRRLAGLGLLKKDPGFYGVKIGLTLAVYAACALTLLLATETLARVGAALVLAFAFAQVAFLGHDAVHQQVFRDGRKNGALGLVFYNLLLGVSVGWWRDDHTRHHTYANQEGMDPNLDLGVLALTAAQATSRRGFTRWTLQIQAYLMFPLFCLEAFSAHALSMRYLRRRGFAKSKVEWALLAIHGAFFVWMFFAQGLLAGLALVLVHQVMAGLYLASVFAPNHKGMPVIEGGSGLDFLRRQVLTSRNVNGHPITDFLYGGLNYQIEHHLFPTMPRHHLSAAQATVRAFCAERGIAYHQTSILDSYREILRHLGSVSAGLRQGSAGTLLARP